jgi:hypothetical protein
VRRRSRGRIRENARLSLSVVRSSNQRSDGNRGAGAVPEPGDMSVCIGCASFLQFNDDLTVRLMTDADVAELPDDIRIQAMRARRVICTRAERVIQTTTDF